MEQLPLPFPLPERYEAEDFISSPSNGVALRWLSRVDWPDRRLAIWGPGGCGKTHLLHNWTRGMAGVFLSGPDLRNLTCLPEGGAVAIDDASRIADQELMLHLLNTARDRGLTLLMAARVAPARWPVSLADLSSRLRAISSVKIDPPDENLLQGLLVRAFAQRQLEVSLSAQTWLLRNLPRTASAILHAARRLDLSSLEQNRRITRSFVIEVLGHDEVSKSSIGPKLQASPDRPFEA